MKVIEQCLVLDTFNAALVSELMCTGHNRLYKDLIRVEIIHRNIETIDIGTPLEDLVVDADVIDAVLEDENCLLYTSRNGEIAIYRDVQREGVSFENAKIVC